MLARMARTRGVILGSTRHMAVRLANQNVRSFSVGSAPEAEGMLGLVKDIINVPEMARKIGSWTVDENETVYNATKFMVERRTGCLCVTRDSKVVGIVTERDYLTSVLHAGRRSETTLIKEIATMDEKLIVAKPVDYLQDCIDLMVHKGIRHLPIQEEGEVVALLGMEDVAKALAEERTVTLHSLHELKTQIKMPVHDG